MGVRILNEQDVRRLLPMPECIEVMAEALKTLAIGNAILPLRPVLWLPEKVGALGMMPAYLGTPPVIGLKVVTVFPGNHGTRYDSHQGAVLLFEIEHGRLLAMVDASSITAIRTAAVSGVATRLLARPQPQTLAILGSGVQAASHLEAMLAVGDLKEVRVWSPNPQNVKRFIEQGSRPARPAIRGCASAREAVSGADLICTTTSAREPVLKGAWIAPGAHINAVGSSVAFTRELDTEAVVRSLLFVDRRESTINEAGDFLFPLKEGAITEDHIRGEIGELLLQSVPGRSGPDQVTLFKSLGLAVEDLAAAHHVYRRSIEEGLGTEVDLGGTKNAIH